MMLRSSKILYIFESRIENKNKWTRRGVWEKEIRDDAQPLILSNWKNGEIEKNVQSRRSGGEGKGPGKGKGGTRSSVWDTLGLNIQVEMSSRYVEILVWNLGADQS